MDYKIIEKESFSVLGRTILTSTKDGENQRQISRFWQESHKDGTVDKLVQIGAGQDLLGICLSMDHAKEQLTYMIGVRSGAEVQEAGYVQAVIPAATWAVFPSVGPMPGAIQKVWERIFQEWFPATGYEHAEGPELEVYPAGDAWSEDYRCEVWIPIVKK
ncbi:GyrI-like domain-containing protein [Paenibacillus sp. P25]|nr:GyrI-like domain-containing protein [Paenibacillus sp. P25]